MIWFSENRLPIIFVSCQCYPARKLQFKMVPLTGKLTTSFLRITRCCFPSLHASLLLSA